MGIPLPLAGVTDQDARFALERLSLQAVAKSDTYLNAKDYGMVGDNSTDNLAAFNKAIAALNKSGGALYIPPGTYLISGVPDTITADDFTVFGAGPATNIRFTTSAAHGTFFTVGQAGTSDSGSSRWTIHDMALQCNAASNTPPTGERAFHLQKGGTGFVYNINALNIGGLCKIGTTANYDDGSGVSNYYDRFQLYGFRNVYGNWNSVTSAPSRIHIINGTDGFYESIRLTASEVNGGKGIHADPTSRGVDQHRFESCEIWGEGSHSENSGHGTTYDGIDWNVYLDFTSGTIFNWVFHQCVFDEGVTGSAYLVSNSGNSICKSVHFLDCHMAVGGAKGNGVRINHQGSGTLNDLKIVGGRVRIKGAPAVKLVTTGAEVDSVGISALEMVQERLASTATNAVRDSVIHDFKHGLSAGDQVVFETSPDGAITAGTTYTILNADPHSDGLEFTLDNGAGSPIPLSTSSNVGSYRILTPRLMQTQDVFGLRVVGCYFGPFEGGNTTQVTYAIEDTGTITAHYAITSNVARGMLTGFSNGLGTGATKVLDHNAT